eukprot:14918779-Heterocapsa_arctica.AAC.1
MEGIQTPPPPANQQPATAQAAPNPRREAASHPAPNGPPQALGQDLGSLGRPLGSPGQAVPHQDRESLHNFFSPRPALDRSGTPNGS